MRPFPNARRVMGEALLVALLALAPVYLAGCWDKREIEEIGFIVGAAIDMQPDTGDILLTVQIAKPFAIGRGSPGGAGPDERPFWSVQSSGKTVLDAATALSEKSSRELLWAHNDLVVFGESFARRGIGDALDFLVRHRESRLRVLPLVIKGSTGNFAALSAESELNPLPSESIAQMLEATRAQLSTTTLMDVNQVSQALKTDGMAIVLPAIELIPVNPEEGTFEGELKRETVSYSPVLSGSAAFMQDKLVGFLSPTETRGRQWVVGQVKQAAISVPYTADSGNEITFRVLASTSKTMVKDSSRTPSFQVTVDATIQLSDSDTHIDPLDDELWTSLERQVATAIESEIRSALEKAQIEYNTDIFGFGELIYRQHPTEWKKLKPHWDSVFKDAAVDISVNAELAGTGLVFRGTRIKD